MIRGMDDAQLGAALRALRIRQRLTQAEVASDVQRASSSSATIRRWIWFVPS
jgi:hypothetical protein